MNILFSVCYHYNRINEIFLAATHYNISIVEHRYLLIEIKQIFLVVYRYIRMDREDE